MGLSRILRQMNHSFFKAVAPVMPFYPDHYALKKSGSEPKMKLSNKTKSMNTLCSVIIIIIVIIISSRSSYLNEALVSG